MAKGSDKGMEEADKLSSMAEENIRQWLLAHPDFLGKNTDLLASAVPTKRQSGDGVVDMQSFLVERLQKEVKYLTRLQDDFVSTARINLHTQKMIHNAIQSLLTATGFTHFVHILTQDLPEILEIDVITLCVEDGPVPLPEMTGLQRLKPGNIERANWSGGNIIMRPEAPSSEAVFGPAMDLVKSDARIKLTAPSLHANAMLAIGSRESGHFDQNQGTELMSFLATCIQSCLQMWLENKNI
ncbi:MAG: DUF484 family protein [Sneathiella sp.]|nr:DUF484 family protein [Sneathiella sp.]